MAAPVVPMKLASTAPIAMKVAFVSGSGRKSPAMRMPPLIVYRLNSSTMNGTNSCKHRIGKNRVDEPCLHAPVGGRDDVVGWPMSFERSAVQERVVRQGQ